MRTHIKESRLSAATKKQTGVSDAEIPEQPENDNMKNTEREIENG